MLGPPTRGPPAATSCIFHDSAHALCTCERAFLLLMCFILRVQPQDFERLPRRSILPDLFCLRGAVGRTSAEARVFHVGVGRDKGSLLHH